LNVLIWRSLIHFFLKLQNFDNAGHTGGQSLCGQNLSDRKVAKMEQ
jgi:hypothetical protein